MKKTILMLILSIAISAQAAWTPPTGSTGAVSAVSVDENGVVVTPENFKEANNINSSTNPVAAGPDGALQYSSGGHLAGFSNLFIDIASGKMAVRAGQNIFRAYNGITNVVDAADSNLIYRLSNQSGKSQIELAENGEVNLLLRGDGLITGKNIDLNDGGLRISSSLFGPVVDFLRNDQGLVNIGPAAGSNSTAFLSVNLGSEAGKNASGSEQVNIGSGSGSYSGGYKSLNFGIMSGKNSSGSNTTSIGRNAGRYNTKAGYLYVGQLITAPTNEADMFGKMGLVIDGNSGEVWIGETGGTTHLRGSVPEINAQTSKIEGLESGTDDFLGILLDRKIEAWSDIGVTYSNAVRVNNPITVTNDSAWTGWTTTGSLTASNEILLLTGQYLLSPVQSNGVARFEVNSYSSQNGTLDTISLLSGTNEVAYPYYGQDAQLKIIAGDPLPGSTAGLYVSGVTMVGYENLTEAATVKYVAGLRRTDAETHADDMTSKRYVDAARLAAEKHAASGISAYANDSSKKLVGDRLELGNFTLVGSGAWQGANFTQSADRATIGTRLDDDIITLDSGLAAVEIQGITQIGTNVTLSIYAQNIIGDPTIGVTTNLMIAFTPIAATITDLGGGNYSAVVDVSGLGSSTGFFRAYGTAAPASAGSVTINADLLNLDGHRIEGVSEIVFTNGAKIVISGNTLVFEAAP
jgi:hypothetical protein